MAYKSTAIAGTKTAVASGPAKLHSITLTNETTTVAFLQVFDALPADVTVGTTVPDLVIESRVYSLNCGTVFHVPFPEPLIFSKGITIASTTTRGGSTGAAQECLITYSPIGR